MLNQRTIKKAVRFEGIGLHSGREAAVTLLPAPPDTGYVFDISGTKIIASSKYVADTSYATTIEKDGVRIRTVEHILAALAGMSVDNVYIGMTGPEVPILDGSSRPFVKALMEAGLEVQKAPRRYMKIVKAVTVHEGDKSATLLPSSVARITCRIDFEHPLITDQSLSLDLDPARFEAEVAPARTFGFLKDAQALRRAGLARGASLENAVVVDDERIMNPGGLRFPDEFVRHKMLDAIGDMALMGMPFIGHMVADKSGHSLNQRLVRETLAQPGCWILVEGEPALEQVSCSVTAG